MKKYRLTVTFTEPVLGTQPQQDTPASDFIRDKAKEEMAKEMARLQKAGLPATDPRMVELANGCEEEMQTLPELEEKGTTGFHRMGERPALMNYHVRGFLKSAAMFYNGKEDANSIKNLRSKTENGVFVRPRMMPFELPEGGEVTILERPLRAMTAQGPRVTLARSEMLPAGSRFTCELHVLDPQFTEKVLRALLDYGAYQGFLQWRTGGYGTFDYTLEPIE